jgi:TonB family protein
MSGFEGLLTGRVLADRYLVDEVIGRGGMGAVYRATDQRLGRHVALKVIMVPGADAALTERLRRRFLQEAQLAAGLRHPNVVTVHDYGTDDTLGLDYLVMALLEGEDLASRTAGGRLAPAASLAVVSQAASGLAAGHRRGLVHRDVKPGNLFLEVDEHGEVQVRILDFGIAQLARDDGAHTAGQGALSPTYAAPEQLRGDTSLTPAADVFSLAAVALYLLNGQRPFSGNADTQAADAEAALARLAAVPGVSPAVRDVLRRALEMDPARRWPTANDFRVALEGANGFARDTLRASALAVAPRPDVGAPDDDVTLFASPADDRTLHAGVAAAPSPPASAGRGAPAGPPPSSPPVVIPAGRRGAGVAPPPPRRGSMWPAALVLGLGAAGALAYLQPWESPGPQVAAVEAPDSAALDSIARQAEADSIARIRRQQAMVQAAVDSVRMADSITRENERLAQEAAGTGAAFPPGGEVVFEDDGVYDLGSVERQPELRNTRDIQRFLERNYPPLLRDSRVDGEVMVNFVLDEEGRPEMGTAQVTSTTHPAFEEPALRAAERMRFRPAQVGGQDVRVRVTLPIRFQTQ